MCHNRFPAAYILQKLHTVLKENWLPPRFCETWPMLDSWEDRAFWIFVHWLLEFAWVCPKAHTGNNFAGFLVWLCPKVDKEASSGSFIFYFFIPFCEEMARTCLESHFPPPLLSHVLSFAIHIFLKFVGLSHGRLQTTIDRNVGICRAHMLFRNPIQVCKTQTKLLTVALHAAHFVVLWCLHGSTKWYIAQ